MLVCNVSLRPARTAIAADIAEVATAVDATAFGNVVFATLVDDPTAVGDIVNAYLGEIMLEAASASESADAGLAYIAGIDEGLTAIAAQDGAVPSIIADAVAEIVTATASVDASTVSGAAITTMSTIGPLREIDATFPASSHTIINVGN